MAKNEAFKLLRRGRWSIYIRGRGAVQYSPDYWTKPTCEAMTRGGVRLSVFNRAEDAHRFGIFLSEQLWRCMYRGKPQKEEPPAGTLRVTSVKLIERVWPKKEKY